jgi:hypothetical protein
MDCHCVDAMNEIPTALRAIVALILVRMLLGQRTLDRNFSTTILVHVLFPERASCVAKLDSIASICSSVMWWAGLGTGRCSRCDLDAHVSDADARPYIARGVLEGDGGEDAPAVASLLLLLLLFRLLRTYGSILEILDL